MHTCLMSAGPTSLYTFDVSSSRFSSWRVRRGACWVGQGRSRRCRRAEGAATRDAARSGGNSARLQLVPRGAQRRAARTSMTMSFSFFCSISCALACMLFCSSGGRAGGPRPEGGGARAVRGVGNTHDGRKRACTSPAAVLVHHPADTGAGWAAGACCPPPGAARGAKRVSGRTLLHLPVRFDLPLYEALQIRHHAALLSPCGTRYPALLLSFRSTRQAI